MGRGKKGENDTRLRARRDGGLILKTVWGRDGEPGRGEDEGYTPFIAFQAVHGRGRIRGGQGIRGREGLPRHVTFSKHAHQQINKNIQVWSVWFHKMHHTMAYFAHLCTFFHNLNRSFTVVFCGNWSSLTITSRKFDTRRVAILPWGKLTLWCEESEYMLRYHRRQKC